MNSCVSVSDGRIYSNILLFFRFDEFSYLISSQKNVYKVNVLKGTRPYRWCLLCDVRYLFTFFCLNSFVCLWWFFMFFIPCKKSSHDTIRMSRETTKNGVKWAMFQNVLIVKRPCHFDLKASDTNLPQKLRFLILKHFKRSKIFRCRHRKIVFYDWNTKNWSTWQNLKF